jgi:competence transcription factor ComK
MGGLKEEEKIGISDDSYEKALEKIFNKRVEFINFTKNYKLNDNLKDKSFNNRFNKTIFLQDLFDKEHDYTEVFFDALNIE